VTKRLGLFLAGAAAIWAITFAIAWAGILTSGGEVWSEQLTALLVSSLAAMLLCLIPTTLTLLWSSWGLKQTPDQQLAVVLGGTGIRMFFVLGLGLLLSQSVPLLRERQIIFWVWLLIYYLATLALEMVLLVRAQALTRAQGTGSPTSLPR
jgi:hypothetical protein